MTKLCDIAFKYKTDKCPQIRHTYTPFYWEFLKDKRESIKKVFEMGIGCADTMVRCSGKEYVTGASLYMWRDFFPNAQIYGGDIHPDTQFEAERIKTFLCNQMNPDDLKRVIGETGSDIDLFIDDGAHYFHQQLFLCNNMMPLLKKDVIYVIEDAHYAGSLAKALVDYDCYIPELEKVKNEYRNNLIVVKNK